mgnify:CR=1 FL=1
MSVSISLLALALQGVANASLIMAAIVFVGVGSYLSWRRRYRPNRLLKLLITAFSLAALASFLRSVYLQPYDPRLPLSELFVWVQALHSFDLPRSKDLLLSLVSSFILLALAASFSLSASFAWVILAWLAAALPALYFAQVSRLRDLSVPPARTIPHQPSPRQLFLTLVVLIVAVSLAGLAIGAFMPRLSATYLRSLSFSLRRAIFPSEGFRFTNPGYPDLPSRPPDKLPEFNPEAYFGFGPYLDLRARGTLVDLPVMKVQASEPAYWSGLTFREYNGYSWLGSEEEPARLHTTVQPFVIDYDPGQAHAATRTVIQTFYLDGEQPNVIFAAYRPYRVYYPSDYIFQDEGGLKSPFTLGDGLVYSVVSHRLESIREASTPRMEVKEGKLLPYLEVPPLPERVLQLADRVIPKGAGPYERAQAIEDFLKSEYEYSLDVPPLPPGEDAVDFFLCEQRRGYCEHFATAYAVLCRLAGIPSRVVTGYSTGEYNPFTGMYEVSLDDAHAWVEIYLESVGWVTMEPTPGFSLPDPGRGSGALWIFRDFFSWLGRGVSTLLPAPLRSALKAGVGAVASAASNLASGFLYSVREAPWLPPLFILALLLAPLLWAARKLGRRRAPPEGHLDEPLLAMRHFLDALSRLGLKRHPSQTAGEYLSALSYLVPGLSLSSELSLFEQARYGQRPLPEEDAQRLSRGLADALHHIRAHFKERQPGWPHGAQAPRA